MIATISTPASNWRIMKFSPQFAIWCPMPSREAYISASITPVRLKITVWRVYLPSMLPVLLEALRISMIFNLTGVILAEMYASRDGIGHQIATWGENFQMKQLLAGVIMIAVIAITFNELVRWVETRCSHWRT